GDAEEVDRSAQYRQGVIARLQQSGHHSRLVDPEQPCPLVHGGGCLLPPLDAAPDDATPLSELSLDAPDSGDQVGQVVKCMAVLAPDSQVVFRWGLPAVLDLGDLRRLPVAQAG